MRREMKETRKGMKKIALYYGGGEEPVFKKNFTTMIKQTGVCNPQTGMIFLYLINSAWTRTCDFKNIFT